MIAVRFRAAICISVYHTQQRMSMRNKKVELLAPAGNAEAFYGAVHAGADAIYLGGNRFGARAYAENFSEDELVDCIRYAHLLGRKVYLTVNTLVKESEFSELYEYLMPYYRAGLDGVIIQDMGVFAFIRDAFPQMELHGSTQMTITGEYGAGCLQSGTRQRTESGRDSSYQRSNRNGNRMFYSWCHVLLLFRSMPLQQYPGRAKRQPRQMCPAMPTAVYRRW